MKKNQIVIMLGLLLVLLSCWILSVWEVNEPVVEPTRTATKMIVVTNTSTATLEPTLTVAVKSTSTVTKTPTNVPTFTGVPTKTPTTVVVLFDPVEKERERSEPAYIITAIYTHTPIPEAATREP